MIIDFKDFYKYSNFKLIIFIIGIAVINTIQAEEGWVVRPYLGMDYKLSYTEAEDSWNRLLPTNKLNSNITAFTGIKFHDYVAGEFSYNKSNSHSKYSDISGWSMFDTIAIAGSQQRIQLGYISWNFDLNSQYPGGKNGFAILGTVGVAAVKPLIEVINIGDPISNIAVTKITGKGKMVPHVGIGIQYIEGMFGLRTRVMWEDASGLRVNNGLYQQQLPNITEIPFKNTFAWTVGLFVIL